MSYSATVYQVFIASPGDLTEERAIARQVILDWNNVNSGCRNIVLQPIGWEQNAFPSMADRPQAVINQQLLDSADILVGIFWTRVGTPTGKAASGTVEEIAQHIAAEKDTLLYFSKRPIQPELLDPVQYAAVKQLKTEYQTKGLTYEFNDPDQFRQDFQNHLGMLLNQDNYSHNEQHESSPETRSSNSTLSDDAKELLSEGVKDVAGQIVRVRYLNGETLSTNDREFLTDTTPRTLTRWDGALDELIEHDFVNRPSPDAEVLSITRKGYAFADGLTPPQSEQST
ncbi:DUF4062 domain-containing protein [Puia sp. P3]|uniref:DUF4062 domain-containing protein n=1 Tax=Puia sp. P3 TaxID=3423952 RepID=UPI003D66AA97